MFPSIPTHYMYYLEQVSGVQEVGVMSVVGYMTDDEVLAFCRENSCVQPPSDVHWIRYPFQGQRQFFVTCFRVPPVVSSSVVVSGPSKSKKESKRLLCLGKLIQGELFNA